jgi:transposase
VGNRLRKVLEDANIKLDSVASDTLGVSGREMILALVRGQSDPSELAELARGRLRAKLPELEKALEGQVTKHHRFLLGELMRQLAFLEGQVVRFEKEIEQQMPPFEWAAGLLMTMPGVDRTAACALIAEIGADMGCFASSRHLASWAGLCPGNNESAGKQRSGKSHRGNRWIKGLMTEIAWAASRTKNSYTQTQYRKLIGHRGKKRALVAVANSLLQAAWHMLTQRQPYKDLGPDYLDRLNQKHLERYLVRKLEQLGHKVTLDAVA